MGDADDAGVTTFYGGASATEVRPRCWRCGRLLAQMVTAPWEIDCSRCKAANRAGSAGSTSNR